MDPTPAKDDVSLSESQTVAIANSPVQLNQREIYTRISSNIELISLYLSINEKIIASPEGRNQSRLFHQLTGTLHQLKQVLDRIEIRVNFVHPWFP